MKEFLNDNWAWLLVASFVVLLAYSVMKISTRNDEGKWEQDDEDIDSSLETGELIDMEFTQGGVEDTEILKKVHRN